MVPPLNISRIHLAPYILIGYYVLNIFILNVLHNPKNWRDIKLFNLVFYQEKESSLQNPLQLVLQFYLDISSGGGKSGEHLSFVDDCITASLLFFRLIQHLLPRALALTLSFRNPALSVIHLAHSITFFSCLRSSRLSPRDSALFYPLCLIALCSTSFSDVNLLPAALEYREP